MNKLFKKRALVTAGAQGIGLAISRQLAAAGCELFVHYRSSEAAARTCISEITGLGGRAGCFSSDLTTTSGANQLVEEAVKFLGGIDLLVNNAGSLVARRSLIDGSDDYWQEVLELNVGSMRRVSRAAAPHLITSAKSNGGASIINLASLAGRKGGHAGSLAYSTAKGAVLTFTRSLANELGPLGVRVNALAPGLILGTSFHQTHTTAESAQATVAGTPLGRAGTADDIARFAVYLASEYDGFMTGATLDINGGVYAA